ncbi:DUF305 domain-containing protein [Cellulomonas sp. 179-A 4D5 NHS]|uniref:DUF305 domain-containing protein n=1 Tax=Cellulomonas sp. 179-A 4D5 NHS TaxID=3142378 RepID=UPI00399F1074
MTARKRLTARTRLTPRPRPTSGAGPTPHARRTATLPGAVAAGVALLLTLTGCAGDPAGDPGAGTSSASEPASTSEVSAEHNDADVQFAQGMIVHHRGAVEMAELAADRTETPEVLDLAERIAAAQGPEIETMTAWLEAWDAEVPADDDMAGMDHGDMDHGDMDHGSMPGMMTDEQMAQLEETEGAEFDEAFLTMMIEHHQGAITMSQDEVDGGENADAIALAEQIIEDQTAEITEMTRLLG